MDEDPLSEEFRSALREMLVDHWPDLSDSEIEEKTNFLYDEAQRIGRELRINYQKEVGE
jgi:hypothetical protein